MSLRQQINRVLMIVVVFPFFGLFAIGLLRTPEHVRHANARINPYGKDGIEMPHCTKGDFRFRLESPVVFEINGKHVRLLGIQEPVEEERRQRAMEFVKDWLEKARKFGVNFGLGVDFTNWSQALQDESGAWLVWATAYYAIGGKQHCLNVELVDAGLADVAYKDHLHYEFREAEYGGFGPFVKWRTLLDQANAARSATKPRAP